MFPGKRSKWMAVVIWAETPKELQQEIKNYIVGNNIKNIYPRMTLDEDKNQIMPTKEDGKWFVKFYHE